MKMTSLEKKLFFIEIQLANYDLCHYFFIKIFLKILDS